LGLVTPFKSNNVKCNLKGVVQIQLLNLALNEFNNFTKSDPSVFEDVHQKVFISLKKMDSYSRFLVVQIRTQNIYCETLDIVPRRGPT